MTQLDNQKTYEEFSKVVHLLIRFLFQLPTLPLFSDDNLNILIKISLDTYLIYDLSKLYQTKHTHYIFSHPIHIESKKVIL